MQRIARIGSLCVVLVTLTGCVTSSRSDVSSLPDPLLATGHRKPMSAPLRRPPPKKIARPKPAVKPPMLSASAGWIPPRGIRKDRWQCVVVHHSASPNDSFQSMHDYHLKAKKWINGLGYHFVIGNGVNSEDGKIYVGPRWRRQISGAHCRSASGRYFGRWRKNNYFNTNGIGICLIGNFENDGPTPRQKRSLRRLIAFLTDSAAIDPSRIYGHDEITHRTACPGRLMNVASLRHSLAGISAASR